MEMLFFKLIILLFIKVTYAQNGKITGIPSLPQEVLQLEFKPKLEAMKIILLKEIDNMDRQVKLAQHLVQSNSASSRSVAIQKIKELKEVLTRAKQEAKYSSVDVKKCINRQELENRKTFVAPPLNCFMNYTNMTAVKSKLVKYQLIIGQLVPNCQKLYMDDTVKDVELFRKCLTDRTDDIYRHISRIREEFDGAFEVVLSNSLQCSIEGNFETFKSIGEVMNSLRSCKYVNNYNIQKLP